MRPITLNPNAASYKKEQQLARLVVEKQEGGEDQRPTKRRRVEVGGKLDELNTLLAAHWDPGQQWDSDANRQKAKLLRTKIGAGYEDAARSLISQTGQYCAYCDVPVFSDLRAAPILPPRWFPAQAFDFDNQLLTCPSCRGVKGENPPRTDGAADALRDSTHLAWPHLFAHGLPDGALLPFRYDLVQLRWNGGEPTVVQLIGQDEIDRLLRYYRLGYVRVERADRSKHGQVLVWPPGSDPDEDLERDESQLPLPEPIAVGVWLSPTSTGRPVEAGVQRLIDLLRLNTIAGGGRGDALDRRLELRTLAYFKALDMRDRILTILALGDTGQYPDLLKRMLELWRSTIQATGFWGVWLSVFRDVPDIQSVLTALLPGTAPRTWVL